MINRQRVMNYALLLFLLALCVFLTSKYSLSRAAESQTPTPSQVPQIIDSQNADKLKLRSLLGHGYAGNIAWTPDGRTMLVTSSTGVSVYDARDLRKAPRQLVDTGSLVAFNADRTLAAVATDNGEMIVYDVQTGKKVNHLKGHTDAIYKMVFGPDRNTLVSASEDSTVRTWDVRTGAQKLTIETPKDSKVFISPNGGVVALYANTFEFWSTQTGKRISVLEDDVYYEPDRGHPAVFSPDGSVFVGYSRALQFWEVQTGHLISSVDLVSTDDDHMHGPANTLAISADKKLVAVGFGEFPTDAPRGYPNTVWMIDAETGKVRAELKGHDGWVTSVAFSPDGTRLASGDGFGTIRVWNTATGRLLVELDNSWAEIRLLAFDPSGTRLAALDGTVRLWDMSVQPLSKLVASYALAGYATSEQFFGQGSPPETENALVFSPDGKTVFAMRDNRTVGAWDVQNGTERFLVRHPQGFLNNLALSPDGAYLVTSSSGDFVREWDAHTGGTITVLANSGSFFTEKRAIAFTHSGTLLAYMREVGPPEPMAGDPARNNIGLLDIRTGRLLSVLEPVDYVSGLAFSPDDRWLVSAGYAFVLWDVRSGTRKFELQEKPTQWAFPPCTLIFSSNGQSIVGWCGFSANTEVDWWDVSTGKRRAEIQASNAAFSPDGSLLAVNTGKAIALWRTSTGERLKSFDLGSISAVSESDMYFIPLAFGYDGTILAVAVSNTVQLWDITTGKQVSVLQTTGIASPNPDHERSIYEIHMYIPQRLSFSPDGTLIAFLRDDGSVWLWDLPSA